MDNLAFDSPTQSLYVSKECLSLGLVDPYKKWRIQTIDIEQYKKTFDKLERINTMYDMTTSYKSYIIPAGKYWLGDPCYVIRDQDWLHFCNEYSFNDTEGNAYINLNDSTPVLAFSTYHGDGCYLDQHGNSYPVDAGMIGLVPWSYTEKFSEKDSTEYLSLSNVVEFAEETLCFTADGILTFGNYIIDTK